MILAILLTAISVAGLIVIWAGGSRCNRCHEWCLDKEDCEERREQELPLDARVGV